MAAVDLLKLQNLVKRSPEGYKAEFQQQYRHFDSMLQIFKLQSSSKASKHSKDFGGLVTFLCHTTPCYKKECANFPEQLIDLVENHFDNLEAFLRKTIVQGLIMLQNREMVTRLRVVPVFFTLLRVSDKHLRAFLKSHIVNDIKKVNQKKQNVKLNNTLQHFVGSMIKDTNPTAARNSLYVMIELWKRKVWRNERTVQVLMDACFLKDTKIVVQALKFFLGLEEIDDEEELDKKNYNKSLEMKKIVQKGLIMAVMKRTGKRQREKDRAMRNVRKLDREANPETASEKGNDTIIKVSAIQLLLDPQQFSERLFSLLKKSNETLEVRMLMMNVISRLVGQHKLILLNFYPFIQKYLQPHQANVTQFLSFLAQATHDLVDPEILSPCVYTLANHFVTDRSSPEVMAVGLNAIREVCTRCPLVMTEELLTDLAQYKKSKQKGVMMASRSLIALFRQINPQLLAKKDRGKAASMALLDGHDYGADMAFGRDNIAFDVEDVSLLEMDDEERNDGDEWDVQSTAQLGSEDEDSEDFEDDDEEDLLNHKDFEDVDEDGEKVGKKKKRKKSSKKKEEDDDVPMLVEGEEVEGGGKRRKLTAAGAAAKQSTASASASAEAEEETAAPKRQPSKLALRKILTPRDFQRIRELKAKQLLEQNGNALKRRREDGSSLLHDTSEYVDESKIVGWQPKYKNSKQERMESIHEGRQTAKHGAPKEKAGGSTNSDKIRNKPFMLTKHSKKLKNNNATQFSNQTKQQQHISTLKKQVKNKRLKKNLTKKR